jgi:uncharacterized damage-inducible protein DinB
MQLIESFRKQFAYTSWANAVHLDSLAELHDPPAQALRWISHILAAEELWQERLFQSGRSIVVWPDLTIPECRGLAGHTAARWRQLLQELDAERLAAAVAYTNSRGERFANTIHDILMHVTAHGAHHRGQIIAEIRASGAEPPYTDYIHAVRQGFVA